MNIDETAVLSPEPDQYIVAVMKDLGDTVIASEAPHGGDLLRPGGESLAELNQLCQAVLVHNQFRNSPAWMQP